MRTITRAEAGVGLRVFGWLICIIGPLMASGSQGGRFLQKLGGDESWQLFGYTVTDSAILMAIGICVICSSPAVGMFVAIANRNGDWPSAIGGIFVWCCIVAFSMQTSTLEIINKAESTVTAQIHESPQVKIINASIEANLKSIASKQGTSDAAIAANARSIKNKQAEIDGRDAVKWADWRSNRTDEITRLNYTNDYQSNKTAAEISKLTQDNLALSAQLTQAEKEGTGSSVAKSLNALERYGVTIVKISILCAFLLDLIPFFASTQIGSSIRIIAVQVSDETSEDAGGAEAVEMSGKPRRGNLRAV